MNEELTFFKGLLNGILLSVPMWVIIIFILTRLFS